MFSLSGDVDSFLEEAKDAGFAGLKKVEAAKCCVELGCNTSFEAVYALITFMESYKAVNTAT